MPSIDLTVWELTFIKHRIERVPMKARMEAETELMRKVQKVLSGETDDKPAGRRSSASRPEPPAVRAGGATLSGRGKAQKASRA